MTGVLLDALALNFSAFMLKLLKLPELKPNSDDLIDCYLFISASFKRGLILLDCSINLTELRSCTVDPDLYLYYIGLGKGILITETRLL